MNTNVIHDVRLRSWVKRHRPGSRVRWGNLRRTTPFSEGFGYDRGTPVDRLYIDDFISLHADDIRGRAMEVRDPLYCGKFVRNGQVSDLTVVDVDPTNPVASLLADLSVPGSLPASSFDCMVVTQTLNYLADLPGAVVNLWQALAPGGVLLLTVPALGRDAGDLWRFLPAGLHRLLHANLPSSARIAVTAHGNALAGAAHFQGLAVEDVGEAQLRVHDERFVVVSAARVERMKAGSR